MHAFCILFLHLLPDYEDMRTEKTYQKTLKQLKIRLSGKHAEAAKHLGCHQSTVTRFLNGDRSARDPEFLLKLAEVAAALEKLADEKIKKAQDVLG